MVNIEFWKPVKNYESYYEVSNCGNVRNFNLKIISPQITQDNYLKVTLYKNNKRKKFSIHRLVAIAFIENPNNLPEVNHKDGNKQNNNDWNLEWITHQNNIIHAYNNNLINKDNFNRYGNNNSNNKIVLKLNKQNEFINEYVSITEAAKINNLDISDICKVCKGKKKSVGGYIWRYKTNIQ